MSWSGAITENRDPSGALANRTNPRKRWASWQVFWAASDGSRFGPLQSLYNGFTIRASDAVLQVEDEPVGRKREGPGDHLLVAAGDEMDRAAKLRHGVACRRIMAALRQRITTSPR